MHSASKDRRFHGEYSVEIQRLSMFVFLGREYFRGCSVAVIKAEVFEHFEENPEHGSFQGILIYQENTPMNIKAKKLLIVEWA